ncbi:MAG: endonuclease domain-containing protein [Thermoplasmata archaeon]|nr:endonuclease domain-containing protein [Thermoplasmata archaeon]
MNLTRMIIRDVARADKRTRVYTRLQNEAAARPGSKRVQTPGGDIWMSPIEATLYDAMRREGLSPIPQYYIQGYYVDFAFPDVGIAVEADGAA